jgi:hypothetical protein
MLEGTAVIDLITRVIFRTAAPVLKLTKYKPILENNAGAPMSSSAYAEKRKTTPRIRTVETTMLPSDAAARLKNGLCKMMTLL